MKLGPSNIYVPQPVEIENPSFTESSVLPPIGWQLGGAGISSSAVLSYDTATPYGGNAQSLVIDAVELYGGVSTLATFPVTFGQVYSIQAALKSVSGDPIEVQLTFLDASGNPIVGYLSSSGGYGYGGYGAGGYGYGKIGIDYQPTLQTQSLSWQVLYAQGTAPYGARSAQVQCFMIGSYGGIGEVGFVNVTLLSNAIPYYLSLVPHQFQNAAMFMQFLAVLLQPLVDMGICASSMNASFGVDAAVGPQQDVLGVILGAKRVLPFAPLGVSASTTEAIASTGIQSVTTNSTSYMDTLTPLTIDSGVNMEVVTPTLVTSGVGFTAVFAKTHLTGASVTSTPPSQSLDDDHYRTLLKAKILKNQWDGQADSLWVPWQGLFPGGSIYITDNQNMTATLFMVGAFDSVDQQMITNGLIVPRPEAVLYNYEFATLPIFGFGNLNPTFVEGFGTGSGSYPGGNWA